MSFINTTGLLVTPVYNGLIVATNAGEREVAKPFFPPPFFLPVSHFPVFPFVGSAAHSFPLERGLPFLQMIFQFTAPHAADL